MLVRARDRRFHEVTTTFRKLRIFRRGDGNALEQSRRSNRARSPKAPHLRTCLPGCYHEPPCGRADSWFAAAHPPTEVEMAGVLGVESAGSGADQRPESFRRTRNSIAIVLLPLLAACASLQHDDESVKRAVALCNAAGVKSGSDAMRDCVERVSRQDRQRADASQTSPAVPSMVGPSIVPQSPPVRGPAMCRQMGAIVSCY